MRTFKIMAAAAGLLALASSGAVQAGDWVAGSASGAAGTNVNVPLSFAGDGVTITTQVTMTVVAPLSVVSATGANGQSCSASGNTVNVVVFSFGALPGASTNYCDVVLAIAPGTPSSPPTLPVSLAGQICAVNGGGNAPTCTVTNGAITVTGGGVATGPNIAYNPAAGASAGTGGPVNFTGVTTPGTTGNGTIVATPSGGAAAGTTTVGTFALSGANPGAFTVTSAATLTFTAGTNTPQNITMTCTSTAAQQTANLQATETITNGATTQRFWQLVCPAGAAAAVPPTLTYVPAAGSTTNVASGTSTTINVGCPTDGSPCNGSGTGLAATSRLESLSATFTGLASPSPSMTCNFVSEAGTILGGGNLDFVATAADPGDIRCTCPIQTTGLPEPFRVDVTERSPASGATTVVRSFNIACDGNQACGTISANPTGSTVNLVNGGAASLVTTVTLAGAQNVTQTVSCVTSNVSAGSTFTVTTTPTPMVLGAGTNTGTVNATCSNTATTTGTATLTCTSVSTGTACPTLNQTYTLSCPGVNVPPPVTNSVPVPAMSEQGRILLAALVLLLGLGVVGFRMRG